MSCFRVFGVFRGSLLFGVFRGSLLFGVFRGSLLFGDKSEFVVAGPASRVGHDYSTL
jgi:hypothetical protein